MAQYRGGSDQFIAMGDEYGLLLVMKRGRIIDFTPDAHNGVRVYRTAVTVRGAKPRSISSRTPPTSSASKRAAAALRGRLRNGETCSVSGSFPRA